MRASAQSTVGTGHPGASAEGWAAHDICLSRPVSRRAREGELGWKSNEPRGLPGDHRRRLRVGVSRERRRPSPSGIRPPRRSRRICIPVCAGPGVPTPCSSGLLSPRLSCSRWGASPVYGPLSETLDPSLQSLIASEHPYIVISGSSRAVADTEVRNRQFVGLLGEVAKTGYEAVVLATDDKDEWMGPLARSRKCSRKHLLVPPKARSDGPASGRQPQPSRRRCVGAARPRLRVVSDGPTKGQLVQGRP